MKTIKKPAAKKAPVKEVEKLSIFKAIRMRIHSGIPRFWKIIRGWTITLAAVAAAVLGVDEALSAIDLPILLTKFFSYSIMFNAGIAAMTLATTTSESVSEKTEKTSKMKLI